MQALSCCRSRNQRCTAYFGKQMFDASIEHVPPRHDYALLGSTNHFNKIIFFPPRSIGEIFCRKGISNQP